MSVSCQHCGAVASFGYELGHRSNCPALQEMPFTAEHHKVARVSEEEMQSRAAALGMARRDTGIAELRASLTAALEDNRRLREALGDLLVAPDLPEIPGDCLTMIELVGRSTTLHGPNWNAFIRARAVYEEGK